MTFACTICSDRLIATADLFTTSCGHVFHYSCLMQWLERSKTCPQCRRKTSEKNIHRIYLNNATTDCDTDLDTIQFKLESAEYQLKLKEADIKSLTEKFDKMKQKHAQLREEFIEMENKSKAHNSVVLTLKQQISFFKTKSKETDKYLEEVNKLKTKLKQMESVELALNGSREDVNGLLKNENDVDSLVLLVVTLKKALLDADKKRINMEHKFKQLQNELTSNRRDIMHLEITNRDMKNQLENLKSSYKDQVSLVKIPKRHREDDKETSVCSSPLLFSDSEVSSLMKGEYTSVHSTHSPYLKLKQCSTAIELGPEKATSSKEVPAYVKQMSIFKKPKASISQAEYSKVESTLYNGLGGQSKEDLFPTPKGSKLGVKRTIGATSKSYSKFRKTLL